MSSTLSTTPKRDHQTWARWSMPAMMDSLPAPAESWLKTSSAAPQSFDDLRQQVREEAWAQGLAEGRLAAQGEQRQLALRWQGLVVALSQPLQQLDIDVEHQLMELSVSLAKQLARREIERHPDMIRDVLRSALEALPAGQHRLQVHLHPEDANLVREHLLEDSDHSYKIIECPLMSRGGLQITSDTVRIDERLETRLERLLSQVMDAQDASMMAPKQANAA